MHFPRTKYRPRVFMDNSVRMCYIKYKILTLSNLSCVKGANIVRML